MASDAPRPAVPSQTCNEGVAAARHGGGRIAALLLGIPALLAVGSYLWLALDRGTFLLWNVPVHESGRFTLAGTVLYVEHFVREIPVDVAYALFLVAALARVARPPSGGAPGPTAGDARAASRTLGWTSLALAALLAAGAVGVAAARGGWGAVWTELLQHRTRPGVLDPGSHWRYHWLSTLWFGVAAHLLVPFVARASAPGGAAPGLPGSDATSDPRRGPSGAWTFAAWGYFVALTLVFGVSAALFTREIATHGPVTLLWALGAVLATGWIGGSSMVADPGERGSRRRCPRWTPAVPFVGIPAYLAVVALSGDVMGAGQTDQGLSAMVAGHLFEHTLDYLFVTFLTVSGCAWMVHRLPARPD